MGARRSTGLRSLFDGREALARLVFFLVFKSEVLYR
jgi:hypothetical protein